MATVRDSHFVRGAERLGRRIDTIRARLGLPLLVEETTQLLLKRVKDRFKREIDPDYRAWKELLPQTLRRKKRDGTANEQKLVRTGSMRDAIRIIRTGTLGTTFLNTGAGLRIGIEEPEIAEYARAQNQGSSTIVARRFLGIGRLDVKAVDSLLRRKAASLESI